jgi:hypothetical protein
MHVELTQDELDTIIDALETMFDQAIDTRNDLPEEEKPAQTAWIEELATLSSKLAKLT